MKLTEQDTTSGNVKETDKENYSRELFKQIQIEDTPFTAVKLQEKWFLTMGKYRLTSHINT